MSSLYPRSSTVDSIIVDLDEEKSSIEQVLSRLSELVEKNDPDLTQECPNGFDFVVRGKPLTRIK
jgi:hypothetical protein